MLLLTGFTGRRLHCLWISIQNFPKALKYQVRGRRYPVRLVFQWKSVLARPRQELWTVVYFNKTGNTFTKGQFLFSMSGNEKRRKWKHSESITMSLCTWQTTDLLCHGNAHNCLVSAMQRHHDEKWKIPKEKKACLPGHYTLEITSCWKLCLFFLLFL